MSQTRPVPSRESRHALSTAEAFYRVFLALPPKERLAAAGYILANAEVRKKFDLLEMPNELTLKAFAEDKQDTPVFETVEDLRRNLL